MKEYIAGDWFYMSGRGAVATMTGSVYDELPGIGEAVRIDGHVYCVDGTEVRGRYSKSRPFSLLVKGRRIKTISHYEDEDSYAPHIMQLNGVNAVRVNNVITIQLDDSDDDRIAIPADKAEDVAKVLLALGDAHEEGPIIENNGSLDEN